MNKKINIRKRVIITSLVTTLVFFILTTPFYSFLGNILQGPKMVSQLEVKQRVEYIDISWTNTKQNTIKEYIIIVNDQENIVKKDAVNFRATIDQSKTEYKIAFVVKDVIGKKNESKEVTLTYPLKEGEVVRSTDIVRGDSEESSGSTMLTYLMIRMPLLLIVLIVCTFWILQFKYRNIKILTLGFYPAVILLPVSILLFSLFYGEEAKFAGVLFSLTFSILFYFVLYFVLLTVNILNNSLYYELPLEQAAKASQFVFSLISAYILFILAFGLNQNLFLKALFVVPLISFLSFSSIVFLKSITIHSALIRTLGISTAMFAAIVVLSTWPISSVYIIISTAVIYYILLSVSLEVKETITRYVFIEYTVLIVLIAFILVINSDWGIIGSVI